MTRLGAVVLTGVLALAQVAHADPVHCQAQIVKKLATYVKVLLKGEEKCLDKENVGKLPGPCPDPTTALKIQTKAADAVSKIAAKCTMADLTALGYRTDCQYEPATQGAEGACAAMPVSSPTDVASCLLCWKAAEAAEFAAILYASHAEEVCGGGLGEDSPQCSDLDFATPLPDQRNLGDTAEEDCQAGIAKAGINYFVARDGLLAKCALAGGTQASCLADLTVQAKLVKAETKKQVLIQKKCGNRAPVPSPPFCCRTGTANQCTLATSRDDCTMNLGGQVQEGKTCAGGTCMPAGVQTVTWWSTCPETGAVLATRDDLTACVDASADQIAAELLCLQLRGNGGADWPCPAADGSPSGAFFARVAP